MCFCQLIPNPKSELSDWFIFLSYIQKPIQKENKNQKLKKKLYNTTVVYFYVFFPSESEFEVRIDKIA